MANWSKRVFEGLNVGAVYRSNIGQEYILRTINRFATSPLILKNLGTGKLEHITPSTFITYNLKTTMNRNGANT